MKRLQYILSLVLCLSFLACSDDNENVNPELIVSTESVTLGKSAQTKDIHVKSNVAWTITSSESWCTVNPASMNESGTHKVVVSVTENPDTEKRDAVLTVSAGGLTKQVNVSQTKSDLLNLTQNTYTVGTAGGQVVVELQISDEYEVDVQNDWITHLDTKAVSTDNLTLVVGYNGSLVERIGTVVVTLGDLTETITINQEAQPLFIEADREGVERDAPELAALMGLGWNLGNTLEVPNNETGWGNAKTTQGLISAVKAAGFNTIRLPCAWDSYIEDSNTHKIKDSWLARVKEVMDYCYHENMYVMLNIHWDGGWLEENPTYAKQEEVNKKQKALWEQIAVYFRDYDEHLLFAGTNEVHYDYNEPTAEHIEVQLSYNQTFVEAVRSTGGKNAYRNLIVQAYNTNIDYAVRYLDMPVDNVSGRIMAEAHYYDPYNFCLNETSNEYLWGKNYIGSPNVSSYGQEDWADEQFNLMKTNFVDKGIPVIIGEYCVSWRDNLSPAELVTHVDARNDYLKYVTNSMVSHDLIPVYWDSGHTGGNGSGIFNRSTGEVVHADALSAIISAKNN